MAGKRANGEGTIRRRKDGTYEARLTMPDGKQRSFYGKTRQEAERKKTAAKHQLNLGLQLVGGERQTTAQYLDAWLDMKRSRVKPKTFRSYEQLTRVHLHPWPGSYPAHQALTTAR